MCNLLRAQLGAVEAEERINTVMGRKWTKFGYQCLGGHNTEKM